jgi:hypothetical protein
MFKCSNVLSKRGVNRAPQIICSNGGAAGQAEQGASCRADVRRLRVTEEFALLLGDRVE